MKHIEVSRKIVLGQKAGAAEIRKSLLERLEKTIEIESLSEGDEKFNIKGTTGTPASITRHARVDFDVEIAMEDGVAKVLISGYTRIAKSLSLFYTFFFLLFLLVGLLPGAISSGPESGPLDVLVFLILGIFVIVDTNRKLGEPKEYLEQTLQSLDTQFG
ncbi:MAG: hypothetical protein EOM26_06495 [Alphaproteobacteria bacterium]|nr:hypothetical protein [Alphaproteobacteria bacterium]